MPSNSDERQIQKSIDKIAKTLELSDIDQLNVSRDFSEYIKFFDAHPSALKQIGLDVSMFLASSGDWENAYQTCEKILPLYREEQGLKIWKMRCLYELERHAELIAYVNANLWQKNALIHVNYLAGRAYEKLGMHTQAQNKFNAVFHANPNYQDIKERFKSEKI